MKICVVGLGEVGGATFLEMQKIGDVTDEFVGVDVSLDARVRARNTLVRPAQILETIPKDADAYILSVWARKDLRDLSRKIFIDMKPGAILSIESTIHPIDAAYFEILSTERDGVHIITCPHRMMPGDPAHGIFNLTRAIGAMTEEGLHAGLNFYSKFMSKGLLRQTTFRIAAMSKVVENTYRFVQIAMAQEIRTACDLMGIDFRELRDVANSKWNISILEARDGIGGKCLPKDSAWFVEAFYPKARITDEAIQDNERYKEIYGQS